MAQLELPISFEIVNVDHLDMEHNCVIGRDVWRTARLAEGQVRWDCDLALLARAHAGHTPLEALEALRLHLVVAGAQLEHVWVAQLS
eukprot:CAMPEP_0179272732 /NCGR_PEP_ID=MMETSP0797-20121207/32652_1 /TAXON_ID=47934 /ORGANISM="Dinophysis acuminata, Strain DAEP01" /LENGTH=86 /DNA_ID=CAMNT_0020981143 /DNA_START=76 /DNA_END=336 /DNA_ORIENTATION=+